METIGVFVLDYLCSMMAGLSYENDHVKGCSLFTVVILCLFRYLQYFYTPLAYSSYIHCQQHPQNTEIQQHQLDKPKFENSGFLALLMFCVVGLTCLEEYFISQKANYKYRKRNGYSFLACLTGEPVCTIYK